MSYFLRRPFFPFYYLLALLEAEAAASYVA